MPRRLPVKPLLAGGAALLAATILVAWFYPSGTYLYVPNTAERLAGRVDVPGEKAQTGDGGIYYVDVTVRKASLLERLFGAARAEGSSLVPAHAVVPEGSTFEEQRQASLQAMARSERVASAVALRAAGYDVPVTNEGVLVEAVAGDAPARKKVKAGDVVVEAAGRTVRTPSQLRAAVGTVEPGDAVALGVRRRGKLLNLTVETLADPTDPERPLIGIRVAQAADIDLPVDVDIDLGRVGGPSAGLPFALDVLDELGEEVDRGRRVAATGALELDGSVRPVGGIKQKTYGARAAGVDVFLVPAGDNAAEARRYAGNLRVIAVENFQQALRALKTIPEK